MPISGIKFKRIMLKLSGEMLGGKEGVGINTQALEMIAEEIALCHKAGFQVGVVIGGGNFFRGEQAKDFGMERAAADYMGMLGTCMNGLALQSKIETNFKIHTRVLTSIPMPSLAEPYIRRKAIKHLSKDRIVIFAGGTGNPLFTTDTAASLRALEVGCEIILKGTKVDGIYDKDPHKFPDAIKIPHLNYFDVISKKLNVMDSTSIAMCMDAKLPVLVFKLTGGGSVVEALKNPSLGTLVTHH